ncbi:hypothetical protein [Marinomonas shanghaiensis]|uniref:hypothetical protein n=1 Tax=Marinomonas shanghaiensis TaxID=2202418 RepID=UPI003A905D46
MAVINIPSHSGDVNLGQINTELHIYNVGPELGHFDIKIGNAAWQNGVNINSGYTITYRPNGQVVLINNWGMSRLQALFGTIACSPEEAGLKISSEARDLSHTKK